MEPAALLKNVSIVLVDARTPANIGAVARCMMNMGLSRLVLVRPPGDDRDEARKLAAGAEAILDRAIRQECLSDAVADQALVVGASRHSGRLRKNIRAPRESASSVVPLLDGNRVAYVFGNEVNGLDRDDLALCHEFVSIPSSDKFPSLNLSHAVMVVAYELFGATLESRSSPGHQLATEGDLELFYTRLQASLEKSGFLESDRSKRMMFSIRQIFGRARLEPRDLQILHGILTSLEHPSENRKL